MRIMLWEVYCGTDLAAAEVGYATGRCYTSMTGAFDPKYPSAGSVQLGVTGAFLAKHGFRVWDFGMQMDYKENMGAVEIVRKDWINLIGECAKSIPKIVCEGTRYNCKEYLTLTKTETEID